MTPQSVPYRSLRALRQACLLGSMWLVGVYAHAASTDLANSPLANSTTSTVKPNIMFILDNSGSMRDDTMPDDVPSSMSKYGPWASQCNGVGYNPNTTYTAPVDSTGTSLGDASFTAASFDGYATSHSTTSLAVANSLVGTNVSLKVDRCTGVITGDTVTFTSSTDSSVYVTGTATRSCASDNSHVVIKVTAVSGSGRVASWKITRNLSLNSAATYYTYSGAETALNYTFSGSNVDTSTTFYKQCNSNIGSTPGSSVFTSVVLTSASAAASKKNYANWYAYYRTRRLAMRAAGGLAFKDLGSDYRVGFTTISDTGATDGSTFLDVKDFDSTQKSTWYTRLYAATGSSTTPLRASLAKVGRYYANKVSGQTYDPMQYSCQRNFAILTTDGYWNTGSESTGYGPTQLDASTNVGQQDGTESRPMYDGGSTAVSTPATTVARTQVVTPITSVTTDKESVVVTVSSSGSGCRRSRVKYTYTLQPKTNTTTVSQTKTDVIDTTTTVTTVVTTTAGGSTSTSTTTSVSSATVSSATVTDSSSSTGYVNSGSTTTTTTSCTSASAVPVGSVYSGPTSSTSSTNGTATTTTISTTGPTTGSATTTTAGPSNTLADVAEYYWKTDLRTSALGNCTGNGGSDVCSNSALTASETDSATWQHMVTYGMGLANGTLSFRSDYVEAKDTAGTAYYQLLQGTLDWPTPVESNSGGDPQNIDDLWHAAVNGRGRYYNARDAASMVASLQSALKKISAQTGSGSAAATSALELTSGTNYVYQALYTTVDWYGDVKAYPLAADGTINTTTAVWSARTLLDSKTGSSSDTRNIYYFKPGSGFQGTLRSFTYANLTTDGLTTNLVNACSASLLSQCSTLSAANQTLADSGANLVNYLRGQTQYEALTNTTSPLFRERTSVLGDIVGSSPVYVGVPTFSYADSGYADFKTDNASRAATLYVGANDGMLHAFNADTGAERWAFIPKALLPNLYKLADTSYGDNHRYFVDGAVVVGDIYAGGAWHTILVGGLNAGGKVYYALDITDPANPTALWEFSDANLGYTYGNPVITKRSDGTWVVAFGSGYNNISGGGDGNGHLFVVNAYTGALVTSVPTYSSGTTAVGSTTAPSGLAKINAWVDDATDNTAKRFYGGDLLGNLWRFDIDNLVLPNSAALRLAQLQTSSTTPQPITTRPVLASLKYAGVNHPVVMVGTGELLGTSDLATTEVQSIYAIKDPLANSPWGDVRSSSSFVKQTLTVDTNTNTSTLLTTNAVDWSTKGGWYLDLPASGERINVNMAMQYNTLTAVSNIPSTDNICSPGGSSWLYNIDALTGGLSVGASVGSQLGSYMAVGLGQVALSSGKIISIISTSTGQLVTKEGGSASSGTSVRRTSWRELTD